MSDKNKINGNMSAGVEGGDAIEAYRRKHRIGNNLNNVISVLIDFHSELVEQSYLGYEVLEEVVDDLKRINQEQKALREQIAALLLRPLETRG